MSGEFPKKMGGVSFWHFLPELGDKLGNHIDRFSSSGPNSKLFLEDIEELTK